jgi:hypothetical protein
MKRAINTHGFKVGDVVRCVDLHNAGDLFWRRQYIVVDDWRWYFQKSDCIRVRLRHDSKLKTYLHDFYNARRFKKVGHVQMKECCWCRFRFEANRKSCPECKAKETSEYGDISRQGSFGICSTAR